MPAIIPPKDKRVDQHEIELGQLDALTHSQGLAIDAAESAIIGLEGRLAATETDIGARPFLTTPLNVPSFFLSRLLNETN